MSPTWTADKILALAPDASSARSAKDLATPRKWATLGHNPRSAWGECQGSGTSPYQTQIDLGEPAFRCTCPSRKFPCKHALGLFLLLDSQPGLFKTSTPPEWVVKWIENRDKHAQQRGEKKDRQAGAVADLEAQAKRTAERESKVAAGLQELGLWLRDVVRGGLAAAQSKPANFWTAPARRMIDAQAPGVARLVREMAGTPASGEGWQERLLERLGRLHLLVEGHQRLDALSAGTQADIRTLIGWTQDQDQLVTEPGLRDTWSALGQRVDEEERLRVQRTWLWGRANRRAAMVLHFAHAGQPLDVSLVPGTRFDAELVFFPGAYPLRALIKRRHAAPEAIDGMDGYAVVEAAVEAHAHALALNPWLERFPMPLQAVVPVRRTERWFVEDADGCLLPLVPRFDKGWPLVALSGGHPVSVFGEWDGDTLLPLSVWAEDRFVEL